MATDIDMLIDLGLDLSDSELEEDALERDEEGRRDDPESDSSGECSSSDEDMEDPCGDGGAEAIDAAIPKGPPARPEDAGTPEASTPRPAARREADDPPPATTGVWSRLGTRRSASPREPHGGKVARIQPPSTKAPHPRGGRRGRRRGRGRYGPGGADSTPNPRRRVSRNAHNQGGRHPASARTDGPGATHGEARRGGEQLDVSGGPRPRGTRQAPPPLMALSLTPPHADGRAPVPERKAPSADTIDPAVRAVLRSISERAAVERISESFGRSALVMQDPFGGMPFPAANSPWAPVLATQAGGFDAETRRVSWETLVAHGPSLYRTFAANPRAASTAKAMRDCVLRQENLIEALASADETLAWCKMCIHHNLPLRPQDPIIGTAAAVLENLATRLRPFLQCYLKARGLCGLDDLCSRRRLSDIKDIASFVLVILARLANRVERGVSEIDYTTVGVGAGETMHFYIPGACMAGLIEILDTHRQECSSRVCELTASHTIAPLYVHGKYFYCNSLF